MGRLGLPLLLFWCSFFPAWWTSVSPARCGAPLVESLRERRGQKLVRVGFGGMEAAVDHGGGWGPRAADWVTPAAGLAVLLWLGRWPAGAQWAACLGLAGTVNAVLVLVLLLRGTAGNWPRAAALLVSAVICFAGLRKMLRAMDRPMRWERLVLLAAATAAVCALLFGVGLDAARPAPPAAAGAWEIPAPGRLFFQRGVNLTAEFPDGYDSRRIAGLLDELRADGVDAVALVPYGFSAPGSGTVRYGGENTMEGDEAVASVAAQAHARGMKVFLKPQLWAGRAFTGDLAYPDPGLRARWFASYGGFVDHYAALARRIHADLYAVGVEFGGLARYEGEWRALIVRARRAYPGPVTYAANFGPEFESIGFWDALDYIGLNNYYPLPDDLAADGVVAKVAAVQARFGKPVIFPEAGFPSVEGANREPWAEPRRPVSTGAQIRCYEALFRAFYKQPWFQGMYWWKVGTNGFGGPDDASHTPWRKPAMEVVKRWYREGGR